MTPARYFDDLFGPHAFPPPGIIATLEEVSEFVRRGNGEGYKPSENPNPNAIDLRSIHAGPAVLPATVIENRPFQYVYAGGSPIGLDGYLASEFAESRRKGIGGSDIAAILGESKYASPLDIYEQKLGLRDPEESEFFRRRSRYEWPGILDYAEERNLRGAAIIAVREDCVTRYDPERPYLRANLDAIVYGDERGPVNLEIKTVNKYVFDRWGEDEAGNKILPIEYLFQVQYEMAISGIHHSDLHFLIGLDKAETFSIGYDPELGSFLMEEASRFWIEQVQHKHPPSNDRDYLDYLSAWVPKSESAIEATPEIDSIVSRLADLRGERKAIEEEEERLSEQVKLYIGENEALTRDGALLVTWKAATSRRFDQKRFSADHPDLADQYKAETTSRRFLIK